MAREIPQQAIDLIKSFEGCRLDAYNDVAGKLTIGWGHLVLRGEGYHLGDTITQEQADGIFIRDLEPAAQAVENAVTVDLNDNQFSALISFAFDLGGGALRSSTLLRELNAGNYDSAADQFLRWNKAGGREVAGLTRRRNAERDLFLS